MPSEVSPSTKKTDAGTRHLVIITITITLLAHREDTIPENTSIAMTATTVQEITPVIIITIMIPTGTMMPTITNTTVPIAAPTAHHPRATPAAAAGTTALSVAEPPEPHVLEAVAR